MAKTLKLLSGYFFPLYDPQELNLIANKSKVDALSYVNNLGQTLEEYETGQRNRKIASGAAALGGLILYEAPYIGMALLVPDLFYDGIDLLKSRNLREALINSTHIGLDLPIIGAFQNIDLPWKWSKDLLKALKKVYADETATAVGVIDDIEGARGNDAVENVLNNLNTKSFKKTDKLIEQPNSTFVKKPIIMKTINKKLNGGLLISRNPVLRFKLGNKIRKMQNAAGGGITLIDKNNDIWLDSSGKKYKRSWIGRKRNISPIEERNFRRYFSEYSETPQLRIGMNGKPIVDNNTSNIENSKVVGTSNSTPKSKNLDDLGYNASSRVIGPKKEIISQKVVTKPQKTNNPSYQFGKMGGWKRSIGKGTIDDKDSLNMLKEMGMEGKSALEVQNEINKVFGSNAVKSDNLWGNLSREGLKALYERWQSLQPTTTETKPTITQPSITQTPEFLERLRQLFIKEETPEQLIDRAIINNVDNLQFKRNGNYNKSEIRDLIRRYGLKAYNFTGNLRKALRQYLNGESNDTSLLTNGLEKFIVPYKQGGQLVSKDPIKRFKLRTKI